MGRPLKNKIVIATAMLLLAGCEGGWFGSGEGEKLPGERVAVLSLQQTLSPDPALSDLPVRLPRPASNPDWPQPGGTASHAMQHLALSDVLKEMWRTDIGSGGGEYDRLMAQPVMADGKIFAMDSASRVSAFDAVSGRRLWSVDLASEDEGDEAFGGGLAVAGGAVYATTGYGDIIALNVDDGSEAWRRTIGVPFRAGPTVSERRLFAVSYDNQLHAVDASNGSLAWNHVGIAENAGLLGAANPAVSAGLVIAPFSSGELVALRVENGRIAWADSLSRRRAMSSVTGLSDINGHPVVANGRVYAVSHAGRMYAIDLRSGARVWEQDIAGIQMPWVAGEFLYLVTAEAEVVCLYARNGRVRWVQPLEKFEDPEDKEGPINWAGPVLAGDRLVLVSSIGDAVAISPYTGKILGRLSLPSGASLAPIVADGVMYILTDNAQLIALR